MVTIREALKRLDIDPQTTTASIQGFGNVAQSAAISYIEMLGGKVACVCCWVQRLVMGCRILSDLGLSLAPPAIREGR